MNHRKHNYLMLGLVAVGAVLFLTGFAGGAVFLLWPLACMAMMVAMMWGMGGMGGMGKKPLEHTHPDGVTHTHDVEKRISSRW
ncbi:MAG: hypothetical protein M3O32_03345 [Actinomycetota bacterium]|nr:hypothetical protein [Actinomycetota bacterium]